MNTEDLISKGYVKVGSKSYCSYWNKGDHTVTVYDETEGILSESTPLPERVSCVDEDTYKYLCEVQTNLYLDKLNSFCKVQSGIVDCLEDLKCVVSGNIDTVELDVIFNKYVGKDDSENYKHYNRGSDKDKIEYIKFQINYLIKEYQSDLIGNFKVANKRLEVILNLSGMFK